MGKKVIQGERRVNAKVLRQQCVWCVQGIAGRPVWWEKKKREQRRIVGNDDRKVNRGQEWGPFVGHFKDFSSYLE